MTAARADRNFLFAHLKVIAGRMPAQKPIATAAAAVASLSGVVDPPQRHECDRGALSAQFKSVQIQTLVLI